MSNWELPLVLFTVVGQWAVGIALILAILDQFVPGLAGEKETPILRKAGIMIFPLCALALIFSIFHLGQPLAAYRAITNFGSSWLSREIWSFILFGICSLAYSYIWWKNLGNVTTRRMVGLLTAVVGVIAVSVSSMVYILPARFAWNTWQTTSAFLLTALLLGSLTLIATFLADKGTEAQLGNALKMTAWIATIALIGIVITLATFAQQSGLSGEQAEAVLLTFSSPLFWIRAIFSLALPTALVISVLASKDAPKTLSRATLLAAVLGELGGRALFYYSVMSQKPF